MELFHVVIFMVITLIVLPYQLNVKANYQSNAEDRPGGAYVYNDTRPSKLGYIPEWDSQGYVFFCLCMGRMGNQLDHFLGGMAFAAALNRTLILPPFRTYRNVRFTEWFRFEPIAAHQKVVLAEDFMEYLAPKYWPIGKRYGFCWLPPTSSETDCKMKEGNPFGPFWEGLGVNFDRSIIYHLTYEDSELPKWKKQYPPERYPVLAFRGAPANFPVKPIHRELQRHLVFSRRIEEEAFQYVEKHFPNKRFLGLHLRNGGDWVNACQHAEAQRNYMASPQCMENTAGLITKDLCLPSVDEVLRLTKHVLKLSKVKTIYVATDKDPMVTVLEEHFKKQQVKVYHADPHLPVIDWAILIKSDYFIGNCVSSFTAFVKRARDLEGKPTYFWGFD